VDTAAHEYLEVRDRNVAVSDVYEPGSTFKTVILTAILGDPDVQIDTTMRLPARYKNFGGVNGEIKDDHGGWDSLTLKQVMEQSSNVGMSDLGWRFYNNRRDTLRHRVERMFPYGKINPDVNAPEYKTWVNDLHRSNRDFLNFCYGYSTRVSALQLITFYNGLGAGGRMMKPQFCKAIVDKDGNTTEIKPVVLNENMCSKRTAELMHDMLEGVVENGTGNNIKNTTYGIAGKTGTAVHSYSNMKRYNASFAGFFPSENPRYTCLVMLENIPVYGRQAAVVFKTISDCVVAVDKSLSNGGVKSVWPRLEEDSAMAQQRPMLTKGRERDIKELYKKLRLPYVGTDSASTWVSYVAATDSTAGHYVPYNPASGKVPNCYGMTAKDAIALLHEGGYKVKVNGYGKVRSQSPQANQAAKKGTTVVLEMR
jgi:cell division protein FtsI (penicillin-binding protein 3)